MVTHRLVLRPPRDTDLQALIALYADPAVNRFCAAATPHGPAAVEAQLQGWIAHWHEMISGSYKIGRPRQLYTGATQRDYVAIDKR